MLIILVVISMGAARMVMAIIGMTVVLAVLLGFFFFNSCI